MKQILTLLCYILTHHTTSAVQASPLVDSQRISFSGYPVASRECLYKAHRLASHSYTTTQEANAYLCVNGGNFIANTARCVRDLPVNADVVEAVWNTMVVCCAMTDTPIDYPIWKFLLLGLDMKQMVKASGESDSNLDFSFRSLTTMAFWIGVYVLGCCAAISMLYAILGVLSDLTHPTRVATEKQDRRTQILCQRPAHADVIDAGSCNGASIPIHQTGVLDRDILHAL